MPLGTPVRALALLGVLALGVPATASAEWQLTPFLGLTFKGNTTITDHEQATDKTHWTFGGAVARMGSGPVGVEGVIVYTPGFFQQDNPPLFLDDGIPVPDIIESRTLAIMGNVVLTTPRSWNEYGLRPFVSGGIGLMRATAIDSLDLTQVNTNLLGYNVGGGAVGFLNERVGLRFDLRYFSNLKPTDDPESSVTARVHLSYWTGSVGVVLKY
jgi:Outer membrane protein beta-barrel domain